MACEQKFAPSTMPHCLEIVRNPQDLYAQDVEQAREEANAIVLGFYHVTHADKHFDAGRIAQTQKSYSKIVHVTFHESYKGTIDRLNEIGHNGKELKDFCDFTCNEMVNALRTTTIGINFLNEGPMKEFCKWTGLTLGCCLVGLPCCFYFIAGSTDRLAKARVCVLADYLDGIQGTDFMKRINGNWTVRMGSNGMYYDEKQSGAPESCPTPDSFPRNLRETQILGWATLHFDPSRVSQSGQQITHMPSDTGRLESGTRCICGASLAVDAKFCGECGQDTRVRKCVSCGTIAPNPTQSFCQECGAKYENHNVI